MRDTSRRRFLKGLTVAGTVAAASAGGVLAAGAAPNDAPPPAVPPNVAGKKMKISVLSYSFRGLLGQGTMDVFGYLETCKYRYGLGAADIWNGFLASTEESYLKKVRDALDERELELADLCSDKTHIWEDDPDARKKNYENALAHLKAAEILGARFLRIDAGGQGDTWTNEQFDYIVKRYQEYAQWAHDHGFKVGAENHWGPEALWPNLQKLYRAVNHPAFGLSCHLGGWHGTDAEKAAADRLAAPWG